MLEELIVTETLNAKKNNVDFGIHELLKLEKHFKYLRFFATTRIKSNKERAKRIFLQHKKNGSVKTDYRKNLYSNNALTEQDIKRISKGLNNSLLNSPEA